MGFIESMQEIEAIMEKIWDLHDKLSDAIHSISRSHFLNSIKSLNRSSTSAVEKKLFNDDADNHRPGFVFFKDFCFHEDNDSSAIQEAKSLNAIRSALESLEDQLEFFHTVQTQQRAERDAAIARLEQSRIVLAMRLAEHHGTKYKVIEEALDFLGDVQDTSCFVYAENLYGSSPISPSGENLARHAENSSSNVVIKVLISALSLAKRSFKLDQVGRILGNAALFAVSMLSLLQLHQVAYKDHPYKQRDLIYSNRNVNKATQLEGSSSNGTLNHLDVMLARG